MFLGTEWGESHDASSGNNVTNFSIPALHASLCASEAALGAVDVLMMHLTSKTTIQKALDVLWDVSLEAEQKSLR